MAVKRLAIHAGFALQRWGRNTNGNDDNVRFQSHRRRKEEEEEEEEGKGASNNLSSSSPMTFWTVSPAL
jgi:hypothetical protein